jgi:hypothetical protein
MNKVIKIWAKEKWKDKNFIELTWTNFTQNLRSEDKGLGAGTIGVNLTQYNKQVADQWGQKTNTNPNLTNWWIFVQDTSLIEQDPDTPEQESNPPTSNHDSSIIWWGFVGEFTRDIQLNTGDARGSIDVYEFGHWINKNKINYNPISCENGFNPIVDGVIVGNKDPYTSYSLFSTNGLKRFGKYTSNDYTASDASSYFFTVRQAAGHIIMRSIDNNFTDFVLYGDWSQVSSSENRWLEQYETIDSFDGKSLTEAMEAIFDSFSWTYYIDDTDNVVIKFKDKFLSTNSTPLILDNSCESFSLMSEQQKYDKIILNGDRILFFNGLTCYTPWQTSITNQPIGVFPDWTTAELALMVQPKIPATLNQNYLEVQGLTFPGATQSILNSNGEAIVDTDERQIERKLAEYKRLRQQNPKVYSSFVFGYCNPINPSSTSNEPANTCLATFRWPGRWGDFTNTSDALNGFNVLSCFPFVSTQTENEVSNGVLTKSPSETLKSNVDIIKYIDDNDKLEINLRLTNHQTPAATEMRYETNGITIDNKLDNDNYSPTFYYRTFGAMDSNGYRTPLWIEGTRSGNGCMSAKLSFNEKGVIIDSDEPEVYSCWYDEIYQTYNDNGTYNTTVRDLGIKRNEWKITNSGATKFDYYARVGLPDWQTVTHWGRFVFSVGMYSSQKLSMVYGLPNGNKILTIDDDSYKLAIVRPGYVYNTNATNPDKLNWATENKVIRNDSMKMAERMQSLWSYYSRDKRAVKLVFALFNTQGQLNKPIGVTKLNDAIGNGISTVKMTDNKVYEVNSYISSYEFDFNETSPRVYVQTEYPDSPRATREKKLKSVFKERKFSDQG